MFTEFEKEILSSGEKRRSVSPLTVRNTLQKIRNKAAKAMEDLLFLGNNRPLQFAQVIGFTRSGKRIGRTKWKNGEQIRPIKSKTQLKRIRRGENAKWLAIVLGINTGVINGDIYDEKNYKMEKEKNTKTIDLYQLGREYAKIIIGLLQSQFLCPKCKSPGLIFHGDENWLWFHYNHEDENPKATFCLIGKVLPKEFIEIPFIVLPQRNSFAMKHCELGPKEDFQFYT